MSYTPLHVHSHYSLLNGLTKIGPLVAAARKRGFSALALTDYGSLYGAIEFYETCLGAGIKPIIGFEAFVSSQSRFEKEQSRDSIAYNLILLAENYEGYRNLMKLSSRGHLDGFFHGQPRIDKELLREHHAGIIALSGPITGEVPALIKAGNLDMARTVAREYADIFGPDNFYLELEDHPAIPGQVEVNTQLIALGRDLNLPLVVTRDAHYLETEDAQAQDILRCIAQGWRVDQPNREDFRFVDRSLGTAEDITSRFRHVLEAIENTGRIAERVNIEIPLNKWHFADVELPPGKTADETLADAARAQVGNYYKELTSEINERLEYELNIIKTKGYSPYFICVSDYVRYAKEHGIVETTRGSAAGSLVSYVLGITTVDPLRFRLPFERFLNPYRPSPPDIDTDFADDRRDEMIKYVTGKYGSDKVAQIITFGTMAARASARDVGRALGLSYSFCDQVAKLIPLGAQGFPMTIERALKEEPELRKLYETNADVRRLLDLAQKVEGCARHTSIHAAGVVISPTSLSDFTPVQRETGGDRIITQYEMHAVETAGLLKMDFLGIRNLSILGKAVEFVEKTTGEKINIYNLPLDDAETFAMLARGETMGTFQLGGSGMTRWLKELKPTTVDDIMAMVALFRPGPMDVIPEYIRRKHNPELVEYLDPRMKKYLGASFGLLVYQDDVILTAIELAGYDWTEADKFRKAIGKKIPEEMEKQKIKFSQGCRTHGQLSSEMAEELWHRIEPFAAYGFNKAHAASYGIVAYQTSYMKAHYPVQYMTAVLQAEAGDSDKVAAIVHECRRMNIEVLPPDVNESFRNFAMVSRPREPGRIRFGLTAIKNVGEHICEEIYRERKEHGSYASLEDFLERVRDKDLNKKSLESLIQAGALDCFLKDRGLLLFNIENLLAFCRETRIRGESGQHSLFSGTEVVLDKKVILKPAPQATIEQKLEWEKNLLGLYLSSHPLASFADIFVPVVTPVSEIESQSRDTWVVVLGVVDSIKKKITKKGEVMLFATIEDQTGSLELLVFPRAYEKTSSLWRERGMVCVVGKTSREEGDGKLFVENAYELSHETAHELVSNLSLGRTRTKDPLAGSGDNGTGSANNEKCVILSLAPDEIKKYTAALKNLFVRYPGEFAVLVKVGANLIRASGKINWNEEVERELAGLIGEGRARARE